MDQFTCFWGRSVDSDHRPLAAPPGQWKTATRTGLTHRLVNGGIARRLKIAATLNTRRGLLTDVEPLTKWL
jgi:hypothetical protein